MSTRRGSQAGARPPQGKAAAGSAGTGRQRAPPPPPRKASEGPSDSKTGEVPPEGANAEGIALPNAGTKPDSLLVSADLINPEAYAEWRYRYHEHVQALARGKVGGEQVNWLAQVPPPPQQTHSSMY